MINEIFETLGFKEEETRTYLSLLDTGPSSAGDLSKKMGIARPTVYGYLEKLISGGLVKQSMERNVKIFIPEPSERLRALYKRKIEQYQSNEKALELLIPELEHKTGMSLFRPRIQFFEGQNGIQNLMQDAWNYKDIQTYTLWPIKAMRDIVTPEFLYYHNIIRIRQNIHLNAIWQRDQTLEMIKTNPIDLGVGGRYLRDIRLAPENMKFQLGYWIYANKVAFISSRKESFGFLIESTELIETLMAQHEITWEASEPLQYSPLGQEKFFADIDRN